MIFSLMLQSFINKYCKQVVLDLSLMVKMSLSDQGDMHVSCHVFFKLFVVDFYLEEGGFETDFLSVPLNNIIPAKAIV